MLREVENDPHYKEQETSQLGVAWLAKYEGGTNV
jgi:hypothetical protein